MELIRAKVNEDFNLNASDESGTFHTDATLGQRTQYADSSEKASFNLIRPAQTQSIVVEGRQVHLYMVTIDSSLMIQMAQGTASQVDDYKGVEYLGFSPARPILKSFQKALTNIKLDNQLQASSDQIELRRQLHRNRTVTVEAANAEAAATRTPGGTAPTVGPLPACLGTSADSPEG
eukprot:COSAG05_NODE_634_length_8193_cov_7.035083_2_plen_177_part_00